MPRHAAALARYGQVLETTHRTNKRTTVIVA